MTTPRRTALFALLTAITLTADHGRAATFTPMATPPTPVGSPSIQLSPAATVAKPVASPSRVVPSASPTPPIKPTSTPAVAAPEERAFQGVDPGTVEEQITPPVATAVPVRPRAFRTPERSAPPAFVAPQADAPPAAANEPLDQAPAPMTGGSGARSADRLVVFRVTARTAVEGFDLRVAYPRSLGSFAANGQPPSCNAGTGAMSAANDRGDGQLHLVVATAQTLPLPLDVFCRFAVAPGASLDANAFDVVVAEVTSDAKRADPSLLIVNVVVR